MIEVAGLVKRFGSFTALGGLDLEVAAGEIHGFLGPNGAGKSTTLRVLLGLIGYHGGSVRILGADPAADPAELHKRLAYVPGDVALWPDLTGGETIDLLARLRGDSDRQRRETLIERFGLNPTKKVRSYSKGNRQKVALISALAAPVELLLLDEPTSGLDPLMEEEFREVVAEANRERGQTVLLSSHILSEVEALCSRVTIIREGKTVETGALKDLRHLHGITVNAELTSSSVPPSLADHRGVHGLRIDGAQVRFSVDPGALSEVLVLLGEVGLKSITSGPPTLEELFLRHYDTALDHDGTAS